MMSLLEKLELVAENQVEVYEAGAETFGATETKSGIGSITLTNVHPVEHGITVKIPKNKNFFDINTFPDENIIDNNKILLVEGRAYSGNNKIRHNDIAGKYLTISFEFEETESFELPTGYI